MKVKRVSKVWLKMYITNIHLLQFKILSNYCTDSSNVPYSCNVPPLNFGKISENFEIPV